MRANIPKSKGMGNQAAMLQQVQKMQEDMAAKQAELEEREYSISAGGGAVTVKINGKKEILALDIQPEIVDPDDIETLSDILVAGINQAIKQVEETSAAEMEQITGTLGALGLPGMGGMPGLF
jgi:DNA-binding YbaB/EbfC family protein